VVGGGGGKAEDGAKFETRPRILGPRVQQGRKLGITRTLNLQRKRVTMGPGKVVSDTRTLSRTSDPPEGDTKGSEV